MTDEPEPDDDPLPYGRLLTPAEAQKHLRISASTVRTWHHRRRWTGLYPAALDRHGRPLFYEADLLALKLRRRIRDKSGRRHHTMRDVGQLRKDPGAADTAPGSMSESR